MRQILVGLAAVALLGAVQFSTVDLPSVPVAPLAQQPDPLPQPRHDKYRDDAHAYCFAGKAGTAMPGNPSAHACQCALMCATNNDGQRTQAEQVTCEMYCTVSRCACHSEETCDVPEIKP